MRRWLLISLVIFPLAGVVTAEQTLFPIVVSFIQFTQNVTNPGAGTLSKNSTNGLLVNAITGSSFDYAVFDPTLTTRILGVPTGTGNVQFGGLIAGTATGGNVVGAGGTGANSTVQINGANATGAGGLVSFAKNGTNQGFLGMSSGITGSGTSSNMAVWGGASNGIEFWTNNGSLRWGVNSAGDFTTGASAHISDSVGTPTISSGFGTSPSISGTDYAMTVIIGSGAGPSGTVNFGHTWSTAPACTWASSSAIGPLLGMVTSTTQVTVTYTANSAGAALYLLCRSS